MHRLLRTADGLFARSLAGGTVEEYQAFAQAVKLGAGAASYDAYAVDPRAPGGGGVACDWGDTSLEEMIEQIGTPQLAPRRPLGPEFTAVEKHIALNEAMLARDRELEAQLEHVRTTVKAFLDGAGSHGEAEVTPIITPEEPASTNTAAAANMEGVEAAATAAVAAAEPAGGTMAAAASTAGTAASQPTDSSETDEATKGPHSS